MQGQTIITTHDVDELFISTVIRLIQRRAFPNLRNIIAKTHSADIARWFPHFRVYAWKLPLVVTLAIFLNMIIAATVGTLIPMFFKRVRIDPAIATGPFVTTAIDVVGIFAYFLLAKALLF